MHNKPFQWAIIGAGPAGIAAVGKLLDAGIDPKSILWVDPQFNAGDLGSLWNNVSSNTTVKLFKEFFLASPAFMYEHAPMDFELNHLPMKSTCRLGLVASPLQWVTQQLCQKIVAKKEMIQSLTLTNRLWHLQGESGAYHAKNTVLAMGATPSALPFDNHKKVPFEIAIDIDRLTPVINKKITYAVFGSSHSAMIIIKHLVDLGVKKIINFYRSPCRYAVDLGDSILFDNTGLKGETAQWTRNNIDGELPKNLVRYLATDKHLELYLPECEKVIYAVGFKPRETLSIKGYDALDYNPHLGIIAPGLFGLGIAYPELKPDKFGFIEQQVGMWKFMLYLKKILPIWLQYGA